MYESFFKFHGRPFLSAPQPKSYFPAAVIESARTTLERLVQRGEGPGLIIGPPGTGKTLLCQMLGQRFAGPLRVVHLASGRLKSCKALLQAILYELGLPYRGLDEGELRLSLLDHLEPTPDGPEGLLLVVDEAHTLSWRLLDELRLITNLVRDGQPRVRVVLAGAPALEERFASPKLSSFAQRLAGRCYLEPLDGTETAAYVRAQLAAVGGDPDKLIDEGALRSVYRASDGIPRLINQICDHALVLACVGGQRHINSEAIDEAWADLQQLPAPWAGPSVTRDLPSDIVEFGHLDDEPSDMPEAIPFCAKSSPEAAPRPLHLAAPEEQLDAIVEQLASLDESPAEPTAATTEVDLDFPEFGDPFGEEFEEEEVVLNRYRCDTELFAQAPRVTSWEGHQLGSLLSAHDSIVTPLVADPGELKIAQSTAAGNIPAGDGASLISVAPDVAAPDVSVTTTHVPHVAPQPSPVVSLTSIAGDRDVIIVEDGPAAVSMPLGRRTGEFRQLFSKLRRG